MDIGARLKEARERQGKSLQEIARITKISPPTLDALERNRFEYLPAGIFGRAFVRGYAREVGLDPEPLIQELVNAHPAATIDTLPQLDTRDDSPARNVRWTVVLGALVVLALVAVGAYLWMASDRVDGGSTVQSIR